MPERMKKCGEDKFVAEILDMSNHLGLIWSQRAEHAKAEGFLVQATERDVPLPPSCVKSWCLQEGDEQAGDVGDCARVTHANNDGTSTQCTRVGRRRGWPKAAARLR